jgi:hypothetical protein
MDLTARDPSKVPRCILSGTAGVSEARAERGSGGEILTPRLDEGESKDLCFLDGKAGVTLSLPNRKPISIAALWHHCCPMSDTTTSEQAGLRKELGLGDLVMAQVLFQPGLAGNHGLPDYRCG